MNARVAFTEKTVLAIPFTASGQAVVRDTELPGFLVRCGRRTKTYYVQGDLRVDGTRQTIWVKIGEVGELTAREARGKAKQMLGSIADGVDPRPKPQPPVAVRDAGEPTLREAWQAYENGHMQRKGRSSGTIANYADHVERGVGVGVDPLWWTGCGLGLLG
jgi:hypothetical protein